MSLSEIRDLVLIIWGCLLVLILAVVLVMTLVVGVAVTSLISNMKRLVNEEVTPLVKSVRKTSDSVRGTTEFVADSAVMPIIRTYGIFAGIRRATAVFTGLKKGRKRRS